MALKRTKTKRTVKQVLGDTHTKLARVTKKYLDQIEEDMKLPEVTEDYEQDEDGEMVKVITRRSRKPPTTFLDFTARFLKQNDITAPADKREDMDELDEAIARIRGKRPDIGSMPMPDINDVKGTA